MTNFSGEIILKALLPFPEKELIKVEEIVKEIDFPIEELVTHCHEKMQKGENFLDWNLVEELLKCIKWKFDEPIINHFYNNDLDNSPATIYNLDAKFSDNACVYEIINETSKYDKKTIKEDILKELNSIPDNERGKIYNWFYKNIKEDL